MGMNRPMMQFHNLLAGSNLPMQAGAAAAAAAAHMGPRFPLPPFATSPVPDSDPSRAQATNNQLNPMANSVGTQNATPPSVSGFPDSYQQFLSSNQMPFHMTQPLQVLFRMLPSFCIEIQRVRLSTLQIGTLNLLQNHQPVQPNTIRPGTSQVPENHENHQSGKLLHISFRSSKYSLVV